MTLLEYQLPSVFAIHLDEGGCWMVHADEESICHHLVRLSLQLPEQLDRAFILACGKRCYTTDGEHGDRA